VSVKARGSTTRRDSAAGRGSQLVGNWA